MERDLWFFQSLMEQVSDALVVVDLKGSIVYVNRGMEILTGYDREELIGKDPAFLNAEENAEEIQADIYRQLKQGKEYNAAIQNRHKDGHIFINKMKIKPFYGPENTVVAYIGIHRDATKETEIAHELTTSQQRYFTIFEINPNFITLVNKDGILIDCNSRCEDYLGYTKEEIIGKHVFKYVHPDYQQLVKCKIADIFTTGKRTYSELKFVRKDGRVIDVSIHTSIVHDAFLGIDHTICVITDITEAKKTECILRESARELKKSNEELEQFAYVASHDLQEPLRVVASYCQLLRESCDTMHDVVDPDIERYFDYIIEATMRMKTLIKDLLDFSRVGRKDKPFEYVNLSKLLKEVIQDFDLRIKETNAKIVIEEKLPTVYGIRFRLRQLLDNLLSNSLKFRHPDRDPLIHVGCCDEESSWLFYIKDNGIGIEPKYYDRIFGLFKRLYSREKYPGTGIGLALCERIAQTHGGKIWVDSSLSDGTYVYFTLSKAFTKPKG